MAEPGSSPREYSQSDKLAIALTCLAGVMAIILFLVEKTPASLLLLLAVMGGLLVYPILHLFHGNNRRLAFAVCVIGIVIFGAAVWPRRGPSLESIAMDVKAVKEKVDAPLPPHKDIGKEVGEMAGATDEATIRKRPDKPAASQAIIDAIVEQYKHEHPKFKPYADHPQYLPTESKEWINKRLNAKGFASVQPEKRYIPPNCPTLLDFTDAKDVHVNSPLIDAGCGQAIDGTRAINLNVTAGAIRGGQQSKPPQ